MCIDGIPYLIVQLESVIPGPHVTRETTWAASVPLIAQLRRAIICFAAACHRRVTDITFSTGQTWRPRRTFNYSISVAPLADVLLDL